MNQRLLESLVHGAHRIVVSEVPFAEDSRPIPRRLQALGEGDLIGMHLRSAPRRVDDAGPIVVTPRKQARTGRRAHRTHVEIGELDPLRRKTVQTGSPDPVVAVGPEITVTLVVGQDDDYVGASFRADFPAAKSKHGGDSHRRADDPNLFRCNVHRGFTDRRSKEEPILVFSPNARGS